MTFACIWPKCASVPSAAFWAVFDRSLSSSTCPLALACGRYSRVAAMPVSLVIASSSAALPYVPCHLEL
jgi:hypothetical protein